MSQSDFVTRGQALVTAGQYQEAVKVCRLGLLGRPTTVEGRVVLGQALLALKRYDEVLAEMRVALELDHGSVIAQTLKGEALLRKGDTQGAIDVFAKARTFAPTDRRVLELLAEAQSQVGRPRISASHPSVGFVSSADGETTAGETKAYINHSSEEPATSNEDGDEDTGGSYTRPTSLAAPSAKQRSQVMKAQPAPGGRGPTPGPAMLAIGDKSGTVEVDPELDGVEIDDDFDDIAAPPASRRKGRAEPARGAAPRAGLPSPRGAAAPSNVPANATPSGKRRRAVQQDQSTVELDDEELFEVEEAPASVRPKKQGGTAVRNAVKMPSGPIDESPRPAATRKTQPPQPAAGPPAHLAQLIANQPHVLEVAPLPQPMPPQPLPPPPYSPPVPQSKSAIAAALPTQAAMPMPMPMGAMPMGAPAAARPTIVATVPAQPDPYGSYGSDPAWLAGQPMGGPVPPHAAQQFMLPTGDPSQQPPMQMPMGGMPMDPQQMMAPIAPPAEISQSGRPLKTGMRRNRSRTQIAVWIVIGAIMIGGGVFAGFKIRALRLGKQITAAREQAVQLAKADTWTGWLGARDRLVGIAQASPTPDNKAALARTRALIAYEFGDGLEDAKALATAVADQTGSLDAQLAAAYVALAGADAKTAKLAADRALAISQEDPAALYVAGLAALLGGDTKAAIVSLKTAADKENRPTYVTGLARAQAENAELSEALATLERALTVTPDQPGALILKGMLLAESGRILPPAAGDNASTLLGTEMRRALEKIVAEGGKAPANQERGVSPLQGALASLAIAKLDFARGDAQGAQTAVLAAIANSVDDPRYAETLVDAMYRTVFLAKARQAAESALAHYPTSRRARITLAQVLVAQDRAADALDALAKLPNLELYPRALAVRGEAKAATGDLEGAAADFDAALKKMPKLEVALVGRARVELAAGDVDAARERLEARWASGPQSTALATTYAMILRQDPASRDKAREILEKVVLGPASHETTKAQLELGRIARDSGDMRGARKAFEDAIRSGSYEARLESGLLLIEDRDPKGGRDQLDALVKEAGDDASAPLLLEAARARMLVGDHTGADLLLGQADKRPDVVKWRLDRERARLAFRKGDYPGATTFINQALDACGDDAETFLVAADIAASSDTKGKLVERVRSQTPERLKKRAETYIIQGKLALSEDKPEEAAQAYSEALKIFDTEKATPRRRAQAQLGNAIVQYFLENDVSARSFFDAALQYDPSLYNAYLYYADMLKEADPKTALEKATLAVTYNPHLVQGWALVGTLQHQLGRKKELEEAIRKVQELQPNSEALRQLKSLR